MEVNTSLTEDIYETEGEAEYDASCKQLLAERVILARILLACIPEFKGAGADEIAGYFIESYPEVSEVSVHSAGGSSKVFGCSTEDTGERKGTVTFDLRFTAKAPEKAGSMKLIFDVEAQNKFYPGYPLIKRAFYYVSRMISAQYGSVFTKEHYEKIIKVYSIWICTHPPQYRANTVNSYRIRESRLIGQTKVDKSQYDLMSVIMICLGDSDQCSGVLRLLAVLLSDKIIAEEKLRILQEEFGIPVTETLESEVIKMCNLSQGVREDGIKEGRKEGCRQEKIRGLRAIMSTLSLSSTDAMNALQIPEEDRDEYERLLK